MQINKTERLVLLSGITVLLLGLVLLVFSYRNKKTDNTGQEKLKRLLADLDTAQPRFEIGYAMVNLNFYKQNEKLSGNNTPDVTAYPVYRNEVSARIESDSPLVNPDYSKMPIEGHSDFASLYRKHKLTHRGTSVICLILKQMGAGTADSVKLEVDRTMIHDYVEIYDALDLGGNEFDSLGIRRGQNTFQKQHFLLKPMVTGSSILVPLCITNMYVCINCHLDPSAWQMASYVAYVPRILTFRNKSGKQLSIALEKNLGKPVYLGM